MGAAGRAGGGSVPPPSSPSPGPSSNGGPRQPSPPSGGSGNGSIPVSSGSGSSNGSGGHQSASNGAPSSSSNGTAQSASPPVRSALSSVGGDSLAGSGFEGERPASGFTPTSVPAVPAGTRAASEPRVGVAPASTRVNAPSDPRSSSSEPSSAGSEAPSGGSPVSDVQSVGSASSGSSSPAPGGRLASGARRTQKTFSNAADRLRGVRRQWGGLPSDAAPHTPPPRMPIDHGE